MKCGVPTCLNEADPTHPLEGARGLCSVHGATIPATPLPLTESEMAYGKLVGENFFLKKELEAVRAQLAERDHELSLMDKACDAYQSETLVADCMAEALLERLVEVENRLDEAQPEVGMGGPKHTKESICKALGLQAGQRAARTALGEHECEATLVIEQQDRQHTAYRNRAETTIAMLTAALHKACAICHGTRKYHPHCYKCDDSGWDHDDCPEQEACYADVHAWLESIPEWK